MDRSARIFVAGHRGLVGSALVRRLRADGYANLLVRTRAEIDLARAADVEAFFRSERPEYVFLAAARVGGIAANAARPADFLRENLLIQTSVIHAAFLSGVKRLLFFGSSCVYPRDCSQPMKEEQLGTGPVEPTSEAYATAKRAGLALCEAYNRQHGTRFLSLIPATLYGPHDNFDPEAGHVLAALLRRFHDGRGSPSVAVWGSGRPVREFLYVDDLVDACLLVMGLPDPPPLGPLNVGTGEGVSIAELARTIGAAVGFGGRIEYDPAKPDGAPAKVLDVSRLRALGWSARTLLRDGIRRTYEWYLSRN
jgi:GDP-L-fucose synthase